MSDQSRNALKHLSEQDLGGTMGGANWPGPLPQAIEIAESERPS